MKSLLTKVAIHRAIGVSLGDQEITVSKMSATPLGPVVSRSVHAPYTAESLPEVLEQLLIPLVGRKRRVPVILGLPTAPIFFATRRASGSDASSSEADQLQNALSSPNLCADDFVVELNRTQVNKQAVTRMAACRKKYLAHVIAVLREMGIRPVRAEPSPCAVVRLAQKQHRSPRRANCVLRVLLGESQGLAVLIDNRLPLAWRVFILPPGGEARAILSAARGLLTHLAHHGLELSMEYVHIHGRADLHQRLKDEQLPSEIETRTLWHETPSYSGDSIATGAALGWLTQDNKAYDLSRTMKPAAPILEIFPWGELVVACGLMGGMAVVMGSHAVKLEESLVSLRAENSLHACLTHHPDSTKLEKDRKNLDGKVQAVRTFLESRILWSNYTRNMSARLPDNASLVMFTGKNALPGGKTKSEPGSLQLQGMVPLTADGSIPREIDSFLSSIPTDPQWKSAFATIKTEIKLPLSKSKELAAVDFAITGSCKSELKGKAKKSSDSDKDQKAEK